jgi:hypothetical protein
MANDAKIILTALDQTGGAFSSASKNLGLLKSNTDAVAAGLRSLTGLLSVGVLAGFAKGVISNAAALDDMAEATGASVEGLSKLQQVARVSGIEMSTVETTILRVNKSLAASDEETKGAAEAWKALGLSVAEMKKLAPEDQVQTLARELAKYADGQNKTAIGQAILSKQWKEAAPLLKDLAEAGTLNAQVTAEQAAQAEKLEKDWNKLTLSAQNYLQEGILSMVAGYTRLIDKVKELGLVQGTVAAFGKDLVPSGASIPQLQARAEKLQHDIDIAKTDKEVEQLGMELGAVQVRLGELLRAQQKGALPQAPALPMAGSSAAVEEDTTKKRAAALTKREKFDKKIAQEWMDEVIADGEEAAREWLVKYEAGLSQETAKALARLEEVAAGRQMDQLMSEGEEAQREWVEAENKRRSEAMFQANQDAAKKSADEWKRQSESIGDSLTDALLRGFESGKDFADNFVESLKNMFSTLILRPIIQPIAQSASGAVLGALGMGSASAAGVGGGGTGDVLGMIGNATSALSGGAGMAYMGSLIGGQFGAGLAFGSTGVAGAAAGVGAMAGAGSAAGTAGAALGLIGAAAPYIAAAIALYAAISERGGGPKTEMRGGAQLFETPGRYASNAGLDSLVEALKKDYAAMATAFGGTAKANIEAMLRVALDPQGDAPNQMMAGLAGGAAYRVYQETGRGQEEAQQWFSEQLPRMLVASLKATDLNDVVDQIFAGIDPATASAEQLTVALNAAQQAMAEMAKVAEETAQATQKVLRDLLAAAHEQMVSWAQAARSVIGTRIDLAGGELSALDPQEKLSLAAQGFTDISRRAALGDRSAFEGLGQSATDYLGAARGYYASGPGYASIYEEVQGALEKAQNLAVRQVNLSGSFNDLITETKTGNAANEAGIQTMILQLKQINARLAAIESGGDLAASAPGSAGGSAGYPAWTPPAAQSPGALPRALRVFSLMR